MESAHYHLHLTNTLFLAVMEEDRQD